MLVKQIESSDTLNIRNKVLRPKLNISDCKFPGDDDEGTFHLGAYIDDILVSIASFYIDNHPLIEDKFQYRLRAMATLKEHRNKGYSRDLLNTAIPIIENNNINVLWCNARSSAVGFYQKTGFKKLGEEFIIKEVGPHFLMIKYLA